MTTSPGPSAHQVRPADAESQGPAGLQGPLQACGMKSARGPERCASVPYIKASLTPLSRAGAPALLIVGSQAWDAG